jgi:hypothetical protein
MNPGNGAVPIMSTFCLPHPTHSVRQQIEERLEPCCFHAVGILKEGSGATVVFGPYGMKIRRQPAKDALFTNGIALSASKMLSFLA